MQAIGIPDLQDTIIVLTLESFLASPSVQAMKHSSKSMVKWGLPDEWASNFVQTPCMLNNPIHDLQAWLAEIGLVPSPVGEQPLQIIFLTIIGGDYHANIAE